MNNLTFNNPMLHLPEKITFSQNDSFRLMDKIPALCQDTICFAKTQKGKNNDLVTTIRSALGRLLGEYTFYYPNNKEMQGCYMETQGDCRKKGIGELMHLVGIINMRENNISDINILSFPEAIPFHSKYKFQPTVKAPFIRDNILSKIKNNFSVDEISRNKAKELYKYSEEIPYCENDKQYLDELNSFLNSYITKYRKDWQNASIDENICMRLSSEEIEKNKDFFNELFKQHKIDYKI